MTARYTDTIGIQTGVRQSNKLLFSAPSICDGLLCMLRPVRLLVDGFGCCQNSASFCVHDDVSHLWRSIERRRAQAARSERARAEQER